MQMERVSKLDRIWIGNSDLDSTILRNLDDRSGGNKLIGRDPSQYLHKDGIVIRSVERETVYCPIEICSLEFHQLPLPKEDLRGTNIKTESQGNWDYGAIRRTGVL